VVSWNSARHKQRRLAELAPRDRWLLLQACVLLPLVALTRRLTSFRRLQDMLTRLLPPPDASAGDGEDRLIEARSVTRIIQIAAAYGVLPTNCLERSLVLWALLRRRGIAGEVCFGVRRDGDDLQAHAWVELDGVVLNDTADVGERFTVVTSTRAEQLRIS
jgi:hypothetical protein